MFLKSTKIVVIGSNIKRKAGPRVGSLGYIYDISSETRSNYLPNCSLFNAVAIFTRFGYQKCPRFEVKKFLLVAPIPLEGANYKKLLNKTIREVQKAPIKPTILKAPINSDILVAAPAKEDFSIQEEWEAKILCRINVEEFQKTAKHITQYPFCDTTEYCNMPKLLNMLPKHIDYFIKDHTNVKNLYHLRRLITIYYSKDNLEEVKELFAFVDMCKVLANKISEKNGINASWLTMHATSISSSLFDWYEFNKKTAKINKFAQEQIRATYKELIAAIEQKGSVIINKHQ